MNITLRTSGLFATNSYILSDDEGVYLVDAPDDNGRMLSLLKDRGRLDAVLLTHGHFDHVMGLGAVLSLFPGTPVYLASPDHFYIRNGKTGNRNYIRWFGIPDEEYTVPEDIPLLDYPEKIGKIRVLPTPGHTPGSVSLLLEDEGVLLSGDTLFEGGEGRVDLGGDYTALVESLGKILRLDGRLKVMPGHGGFTTVEDERRRLMI